MKVGRKLDRLVAEKVMGWSDQCDGAGMFETGKDVRYLPFFSSSIADAWEVVEKLGLTVAPAIYTKKWVATENYEHYLHDAGGGSEADTAPLAICLAALKAVE